MTNYRKKLKKKNTIFTLSYSKGTLQNITEHINYCPCTSTFIYL